MPIMNVLIFFLLSILVIAVGLSFGIVAVRIVDIIDEVTSEDDIDDTLDWLKTEEAILKK